MHYTTSCNENSNKGGLDIMEWMNRGGNAPQQNNQQSAAPSSAGTTAHRPAPTSGKQKHVTDGKVWRIASVIILFGVTLLVAAVITYLIVFKPARTNQGQYVDTTKYQAVFLAGGQVYFGKITTTNNQYLRLNDIYYLRVNQQVQPNGQTSNGDVQLVKLGCELHGPDDQMVINNDQVIFWENLKTDGQVTQAIEKYMKENPDGQKCQTAQQQSNTNQNNTTTDPNKKQ